MSMTKLVFMLRDDGVGALRHLPGERARGLDDHLALPQQASAR